MKWNWQIDGWPRFSYDPDALKRLEAEFLTASGLMLGVCDHLEGEELDELRVELMSDEALKTSEIESMHPFEDGNGRIGRFIAEKSLSQDLRRPTLIALSRAIEADRKSYYAALERVNRSLEITDWLVWFAKTALNAQEFSIQTVRFLLRKSKLYARIGHLINERQSKVLARMFAEGLAGFKGGLSAENYMRISKTSASTATRDLRDLVAKGALSRTGERKATRYHLKLD